MKHDYTNMSNALENSCKQNDTENSWSTWPVRHFHIVPAFWGFNISGLNLVETGHSNLMYYASNCSSIAGHVFNDVT